jgi:hypothetical protein
MKHTPMRQGIAMIELIFAIVIMAIVLMSAPMMISTATKSSNVSLQQESIAIAAAEIGMILTHHWDEGDTNETNSGPILLTASIADLNEKVPTGRRAGTPASSNRSFYTSLGGTLNTSTNLNNTEGGERDDIDDYNGLNSTLLDSNATTTVSGDVVDRNMVIRSTVGYIYDRPSNGATYVGSGATLTLNDPFNTAASEATSNIKSVNVVLTTTNTNEELNKTIRLNAFSCNIGTYELNERNF